MTPSAILGTSDSTQCVSSATSFLMQPANRRDSADPQSLLRLFFQWDRLLHVFLAAYTSDKAQLDIL
jgi:hypothetical protein